MNVFGVLGFTTPWLLLSLLVVVSQMQLLSHTYRIRYDPHTASPAC